MIRKSRRWKEGRNSLRLTFFILFIYSDFTNDGSSLDDMKRHLNKVLRHVPQRGNLDLKNVLESVYFFS